MTSAVLSRPGSDNLAADPLDLFRTVFPGEVLTAFEVNCIFRALHYVRTTDTGKALEFPVIGRASSRYHTPGTRITANGQQIRHTEKLVPIDGKVIADVFLADVDEAMIHYDLRSRYARELGGALARREDQAVAIKIALAARSAALLTGLDGGTVVSTANMHSSASVLVAGIFTAAQTMDENELPEYGRNLALRPLQYYLVIQAKDAINKDWGGAGMYSTGKLWNIAGFDVHKSNNIPNTNITSNESALQQSTYYGDFTNTVSLAWQEEAVCTASLMGLSVQKEDSVDLQGTLMVARMMVGRDVLRPECAVELAKT